jgi:cadmium resistance protein CadD (predicted permease)
MSHTDNRRACPAIRRFSSCLLFSHDQVLARRYVGRLMMTSMLTLIAYRFAVDTQLPRLPYMTRLDVFILTGTILVFFSLIEVLVTTVLNDKQQTERAKKIDRYCHVIFPLVFAIASVAIFAKPRD